MKTVITTITTEDYFQHYLPLYIYILKRDYPEYDVKTFIKGKPDKLTKKALDYLREYIKFDNPISVFKGYSLKESTINCMRFLVPEKHFKGYKYIIFTDIDLLLFRTKPTLLDWHVKRMKKLKTCYAGHHGPYKAPYRPHISSKGWKGEFERVSAGYFMATQSWFKHTKASRKNYRRLAKQGRLGGYREIDEVMLARIIKESRLPMPPLYKKNFNINLRGVHLGDFKSSMKDRYTSDKKMSRKVTKGSIKKFYSLEEDKVWQHLLEIISEDHKIKKRFLIANKTFNRIRKKK